MQMHFFSSFFAYPGANGFLHILHFFWQFFCICFAFSFLLISQSMDKFVSRGVANDAAADVDDTLELTDDEGDDEPDLEEPEEPEKKKVKLNYGAKTTPASRARQYPSSTFEVRGDCMWCCACQKPVCHTRKSIADQHLDRPSHKKIGCGVAFFLHLFAFICIFLHRIFCNLNLHLSVPQGLVVMPLSCSANFYKWHEGYSAREVRLC